MVRRFSFWLSPAGIVIGYLLALFAVTAAGVAFPFSIVPLGLMIVVVGVFFVVAIPVIVMACVLMAIAFARGIMGLGHRLLFGADRNSGWKRTVEKHMKPPAPDSRLWDRWIDGAA
jgi:hypothetical protein